MKHEIRVSRVLEIMLIMSMRKPSMPYRTTTAPDIVIPVRIVLGFPALHEPAVLVGGMVYHQIHNNADAPLMGL